MGVHVGDAQLFPLGSTWYGTDTDRIPAAADYGNVDIEGASRSFRREEEINDSAAIPGGGDLVAKCVRNVHSAALSPGQAVQYAKTPIGYDRQVILGPAGVDGECAGAVDPWLNRDVEVGDLFWIIQKGVCPVKVLAAGMTPSDFGAAVATAAVAGDFGEGTLDTVPTAVGRWAQDTAVAAGGKALVLLDVWGA